MAAATYAGGRPGPRHLRLVTAEEYEARAADEGRARMDLVYARRRLVAAGLAVLFLVGLGLALGRAGTQRADGLSEALSGTGGGGSVSGVVGSGADAAATLPIAQREYVVQPGDTLWKIARALQPEGDVRPLVYQLAKARGGAPLRAGERIRMP